MKLNRLWQTLLYFDVIPFISCLQKIFNKQEKSSKYNLKNMDLILIIDEETLLTKILINKLLQKNYQVRILTKNITKFQESFGDNIEIITTDLTLPETLNNKIFSNVNTIILCHQQGINNLINLARTNLRLGEKILFDFTKSSLELKEIWGAVDDVVMGGVSESNIKLAGNKAIFSGIVSTENNGGFASVRTKNFSIPWNLSAYEGIQLRIQGDGKRYKFISRCEGKWDGISYCYSFDTLSNCWLTINIPFKDLIPVFRAKTVRDAGNFDSSKVYAMQLMLSKFEYDGGYNPNFQPGAFALEIESIKVYGGKNIPQLILISKGENEENLVTNSGLDYAIIRVENTNITDEPIAQKCLTIINNSDACNQIFNVTK